jgi:DNA-directed RNA polymerase subunit L
METSKEVIDELSKILDATPKNLNKNKITSIDKAKELVYKMEHPLEGVSIIKVAAKQLALISVDEIIEFLLQASKYLAFPQQVIYWQEVKQEIEKL